jgi:preprotein translocase subunit Sec61beta
MDEAGGPGTPGRSAGFLTTMRAVLWSFFGVRRRAEYEKDAVRLNPVYVIVAGIGAAAVFVLTLLMIVRMVVSQ